MSAPPQGPDVLALRLEADGRIREVVIDLLGRARGASALGDLLDAGSRRKAAAMLEELGRRDHVADRELVVAGVHGTDGTDVVPAAVLTWLGWHDGDHLLVVGATTSIEAESVHEELLRINNEQSNLLRRTVSEQVRRRRGSESQTVTGLMELNNELSAAQRELAKQNVTLERLNEEKDRLLGAVAHDLRNPLTAITGLATAVASGRAGDIGDEARHLVSRIAAIGRHMADLVDDLVDLSAVASGRVRLDLEDVEVGEVLADVVELLGFDAEDKDIAIDVTAPPGLVVRADRGKLHQVVQNLVDNAVKYSPPGSTARVLAERADGECLHLAVSDQGVGIPADELDQLFQPFGTTSATTTGGEPSTGLGLAIVQRLVAAHGGRVEVESKAGAGSTFEVWLPLAGPQGGEQDLPARTVDP